MNLRRLRSPDTIFAKIRDAVVMGWRYFTSFNFTKVKAIWLNFHFAQRCYVGATIVLFFLKLIGAKYGVTVGIPVLIVSLGLIYEFWPRFSRLWEHLLGKAAILFFYAIIANFALAHSSGLVNAVTGVTASALPYSHNFALILVLPTWLIIVSLIMLVILQLLAPFYVLLLLILKPFGLNGLRHKPEYQYVLSTALLRYFWMLMLLIYVSLAAAKVGVINQGTPLLGSVYSAIAEGFYSAVNDVDAKALAEKKQKDRELQQQIMRNANSFYTAQNRLLADFIYNNEADNRSRCEHPENSRVIELNDFEILIITPVDIDENESLQLEAQGIFPIPYTFEVVACESAAFRGKAPSV
ncbi:MAG: hypothetical protein HWD84_07995 [Flavobacteriaceae bacterium]|nr:hypothetical protein [Flavobacteriaceae bacterium]